MIRKSFLVCGTFLMLSFSALAQSGLPSSTPLPCTPSKLGDTAPWNHNVEVLSSFPKDSYPPRMIGTFRGKKEDYWLFLFEDEKGVFGYLLSPVLEADSPTSRLYDAVLDRNKGTLQFSAKFSDGRRRFNGLLSNNSVKGTFTNSTWTDTVVLKKRKSPWSEDYVSRAQFDCGMILFRRY